MARGGVWGGGGWGVCVCVCVCVFFLSFVFLSQGFFQ